MPRPRVTDAAVAEAMKRFLAESDSFAAHDYTRWAKGGNAPSFGVIISRYGAWKTALHMAREGLPVPEKPIPLDRRSPREVVVRPGTAAIAVLAGDMSRLAEVVVDEPEWAVVRQVIEFVGLETAVDHLPHRVVSEGASALERAAVMCATDKNLSEAARSLGLSRERVRQLVNLLHPDATAVFSRARERARDRQDAELAQSWSQQHAGTSYKALCQAYGWTMQRARTALGDRVALHPLAGRTAESDTEDAVRSVREFHEQTGSTSGNKYDAWAKENGRVSLQGVYIRLGSWSGALEAAGIEQTSPQRKKPGVPRTYDDDALRAALTHAVIATMPEPTTRNVEAYLLDQEGVPSLALIRRRLGSFPRHRAEALHLISRHDRGEQVPSWVLRGIEDAGRRGHHL